MAEIEVTTFARHNTQKGVTRNQDEWDAHHLTKIIKSEPVNGSFPLAVNGVKCTINAQNADLARWEVARRFADRILADHPLGGTIVPVPNGDAIVGGPEMFKTLDFARRIAAKGAPRLTTSPLLRWKEDLGKAHLKQRQRDVWRHKQNLSLPPPGNARIILFDDVVTTGSQLEACRQVMTETGYNVIGAYSVIEVLETDERGSPFGFRTTSRDPVDMADFFSEV